MMILVALTVLPGVLVCITLACMVVLLLGVALWTDRG